MSFDCHIEKKLLVYFLVIKSENVTSFCPHLCSTIAVVEHGSSAIECRTRNQVSRVRIPLCYRFEDWAFSFSPLTPQMTQLYEYLAIDSGGNVSDLVVAHNCCTARMLPGEAELVSE